MLDEIAQQNTLKTIFLRDKKYQFFISTSDVASKHKIIWKLKFLWCNYQASLNLIANWLGLQGVVFSCSIFYQQIYKYIKAKLPRLYMATKYSWCRLSWASFITSTVDDEKMRFIKWCCIVHWNEPKHVSIFQ